MGPLFEEVLAHYGDDASLVFKHFPLSFHKKAQLAAEATMAANAQGKFWEYADLIWADQKKIDRPDLEAKAEKLGLDMEKFRKALDGGEFAARVKEDFAMGQRSGVGGTPTIFVNGRKYQGPRTGKQMVELIDREILKKQ